MTTQVATVGVKDSPAGSEQWVHRFAEGSPPACCPPFRLPIARLAAARAAIAGRR